MSIKFSAVPFLGPCIYEKLFGPSGPIAMAPLTDPYRLSHEAKELDGPTGKSELDTDVARVQGGDLFGTTSTPKLEDFVFFASAQRIAERIEDGKQYVDV